MYENREETKRGFVDGQFDLSPILANPTVILELEDSVACKRIDTFAGFKSVDLAF